MIAFSACLIVLDFAIGFLFSISGFMTTFTAPGEGWRQILLGMALILNGAAILYVAQHGGD